jgi:putative hemolysin
MVHMSRDVSFSRGRGRARHSNHTTEFDMPNSTPKKKNNKAAAAANYCARRGKENR